MPTYTIRGTLQNAPRTGHGYGFMTPDDGGDNVYISTYAMRTSGLRFIDIGCRVEGRVRDNENGSQPFIEVVWRVNDEVCGETPDPVEQEILHRLSKIERMAARLLIELKGGEEDD
jgi:cold shock CspA family protein